jgi:large subunit ribosomal protein L4
MVRGALRSVLSDRLQAGRLLIVDEFKLAQIKTQEMGEILGKLDLDQVLIVDDSNRNLELSARNLPRVKVLRTEGLNAYDVVRNEWLVLTQRAAQAINGRLA